VRSPFGRGRRRRARLRPLRQFADNLLHKLERVDGRIASAVGCDPSRDRAEVLDRGVEEFVAILALPDESESRVRRGVKRSAQSFEAFGVGGAHAQRFRFRRHGEFLLCAAAQQLCKGAPWVIRSQDLEREDVRAEAQARRSRRPLSRDPHQEVFDF